MDKTDGITTKVTKTSDGLGLTLEAMFDGMQGILQTKAVVGDPIILPDLTMVPLVEVSTGMAGGSFAESAREKGAAAMATKMRPVGVLVVQNGRAKLIKVENEDAVSKLVDLIPEALDRLTGKKISKLAEEEAEKVLDGMSVEIENE